MCVLALAWQAHPKWRLVVAGNRDELHARPAAPLGRWEKPDGLLAGQDLQSGGTWLGISEAGRFAVVTNLRGHGAPKVDAPSRGLLLSDWLAGAGRFAQLTTSDMALFSPLNLLTLADDQLTFWTNRPEPEQRLLAAGVYGLSNGMLEEPWPKTMRLKTILSSWLESDKEDFGDLLAGLREEVPADPAQSSIFIRNPVYGTRCSSVVAIDHENKGLFVERRFDPDGHAVGDTALGFTWPG